MARRPPLWVPLIPLAAAAALLGVGISEGARRANEPRNVPWVEPAEVALDDFPAWADPRWRLELEHLLATFPAFRADDAGALEALRAELAALSFVAAADGPAVDGAGGLRLGFKLRRPAAALPTPGGYLPVDACGVILSGVWPSPPRCGDLWLPVILPGADEEGAPLDFDLASPGDWLDAPEHLAALDTALSLAEELPPLDLARLGRVAIDGTGFRVHSPLDPGVLILLEDERLIVFGRPPSCGEPGELSAQRKWKSVSAALAELGRGGDAPFWDLADVRWDVPELRYRGEASERIAASLSAPALARGGAGAGWPSAWSTADDPPEPSAPQAPSAGSTAARPPAPSAAGRARVR
jgi:hypothetical protein